MNLLSLSVRIYIVDKKSCWTRFQRRHVRTAETMARSAAGEPVAAISDKKENTVRGPTLKNSLKECPCLCLLSSLTKQKVHCFVCSKLTLSPMTNSCSENTSVIGLWWNMREPGLNSFVIHFNWIVRILFRVGTQIWIQHPLKMILIVLWVRWQDKEVNWLTMKLWHEHSPHRLGLWCIIRTGQCKISWALRLVDEFVSLFDLLYVASYYFCNSCSCTDEIKEKNHMPSRDSSLPRAWRTCHAC